MVLQNKCLDILNGRSGGEKKIPPPKKYLLLKWCHFSICDKLKKLQHFKVKLQD